MVWDGTITVGNVLTVGVLLLGGFGGYCKVLLALSGLKKDVGYLGERLSRLEDKAP